MTAVAQWLRCLLQIGRSLVRSKLVSLEFFTNIKCFRSHYGPGVDSASNRNEYQEHLLRVKAAGALPPSCAVVTKSGNIKFLESSGPLQACNGIALTFYLVRGIGLCPFCGRWCIGCMISYFLLYCLLWNLIYLFITKFFSHWRVKDWGASSFYLKLKPMQSSEMDDCVFDIIWWIFDGERRSSCANFWKENI